MQTIKPQDFSSKVTDPNRENWTLATIEHVVETLKGRRVVVETDKGTGHSVEGEIVGYASSGSSNPGPRLQVRTSYVDAEGVTRFQTTNYLLWSVGVIVDLERDFTSPKYVALDRRRKAEERARVAFFEETGIERWAPDAASLEVTGFGFGRYGVRYLTKGQRSYEGVYREITVRDEEPASV